MRDVGEFIGFIIIVLSLLYWGFLGGVSISKKAKIIGLKYMAPCLEQGYTKTKCYELAIEEIDNDQSK